MLNKSTKVIKMKNTKSLIIVIEGIKIVFTRTRTITALFAGDHIYYKWECNFKNEFRSYYCTSGKRESLLAQLKYQIKAYKNLLTKVVA